MAVDLRAQIFQLREQGASQRGIAKQLGITPSKVQRELGKRATEVRAEREETPLDGLGGGLELGLGMSPLVPPALGGDPLLAEERAQVEREQLQLRRAQLRAQRLEAERRAQLLEQPDAGGGNGLVAVILQALDRQREDTRSLLSQLASRQAAPPPPPTSLTDELNKYTQMAEVVARFAPAKPPSAAAELEYTVATQRIQLEGQDLAARREAELAERRERVAAEARRNDAVANAIEQFAPVLAQAANMWFEEQRTQRRPAPPQLPAAEGEEPAQPHLVDNPAELEGVCPSCQTAIGLTVGGDERCPKCGSTLVAVEGRIRVRMPNGQLWPPLSGSTN